MQTNFTSEQLANPIMAQSNVELSACLQCGYCINNCPTYQLLGDEFDSPRGRIYLIKEMLENGGEPSKKTVNHIDRCLSCLVCMSTCPSSVNYMHLVDHAREYIEDNYDRPLFDRIQRWVLAQILPYSKRLRIMMRLGQLAKSLPSSPLPKRMRAMLELVPNTLSPSNPNDEPQVVPAKGECKRRVVLMTGCAQKALNTNINNATIRILRRHGCEVVVADGASCCGALTYHMGKSQPSLAMAAKNIRAWMKEVNDAGLDAVVINASGCGVMVKNYVEIFRNSDLSQDAATISALAQDITEVLSKIDLDYKAMPNLRVAYHATCSLQFGQRIRFTPKKLLKAAGFTVLEPKDPHTCCGSAGTYNLLQPEISKQLRARKVESLQLGAPHVIAAGNIGCMLQIGSATKIPVVHTVELLDWATGGPLPPVLEGEVHVAVTNK